jgi:phage tail sheath protein FI
VLALIALCEQYRMDCMAIIDPPFGLTPTEIVQWQQGSHPLNRDQLNSDCAALYWPWVQISDSFNGINVWVPPSGAVLATYAYSDSIGNPWSAPAGMTRGIVSGITGVFAQPTAAERNLMYQMTNAINPIVTFSDVANYLIWGDKTLQQTPTLLDRVPVRRLLFFIEKSIRAACRKLLFEPHTQAFHDAFTTIASTILNQVMVGGGIYNFIIDDDWSLNTPTVVAQNEFRANIGIQPIPTVEFIFVTFSLHNQGTWDTSNT